MTPGQKAACQELFRRGDISFLLHPAQRRLYDWLNANEREMAVICISRQWGKSFLLVAYALAYCLTHPRKTVLFVAPTARQLGDYIMPEINVLFAFLPDDAVPMQRGFTWQFPNGATFRCEGLSVAKGARLRGNAADMVILDECRDMTGLQESIESHLAPMLTTTDGRMIMISTPPASPLHEFTDKYIREGIAGGYFFSSTYKENPMLSTKRLRYLMQDLHPGGEANPTFRREYLADYTTADKSKLVVREWDEESNDLFFETYKGPPNPVRPYVAMDYGWGDPTGLLVGYYDPGEACLIIEDEWFERGKNTEDVGLQLIEMEKRMAARLPGAVEPVRIMDIDPSMMSSLWMSFGLKFEPAYKVPSKVAMLNKLRVAFVQGRVRVRKTCPQLRFQLNAGVFNDSGSDYMRTARGGHLDLLDACVYAVLNVRWSEVLADANNPWAVKQGQMRIGPFSPPGGSFGSGVTSRPA